MAQNVDFKVINSHIDTNINSSSTNTSASFSTLSTSIDAKPSSALTVINGGGTGIDEEQLNKLLQTKQDTLVSGTNIKTINNYSILGAGNLKVVSPEELELLDQTYRDETLNINDRINTLNSSLSLVATSGEYEDLLNKPKIPAKTSDLDNDLNFIDKNIADLTNYSKTSDFKQVAFTGNYSDLINTPNIPTRTSQLTNDSNYTTLTDLSKVTELIPNTATTDNQLADKNFVNSSISTATAEFRGTVEDLDSLNSITANINDYAFYKHVDANGNTLFDRYKFTDKWEYEYTLNNSSFTAEQWATINSGLTANSIPTKTSQLTNDSNYLTKTNGDSYYQAKGDYALKSEMPTVNNASLVIQQNGVDIATFTANSEIDTTVDITIPTNYVDLTSNQTIDDTKIFTVVPKVYKNAYVNADVVIPDEYQLVEYIQSSGVEYIDTNSRIIANTRFTCTWGSVFNNGSLVSTSTENKGYGQGNASGANPNITGGGRLQNGVITFWISGSNYSTSLNAPLSTSVYTDIITTSENTLNFSMTDIINNTVFINNTITNFTNYPVHNMFLFRDSSGQYPFYSAKKIYDVKFETRASSSEDFVVVKHLIPCYRKSDNVYGFYDIIGNEFYTNKGTGTFIAGPDVVDGKLLYNLGFNYNTMLSELRSITGYDSSKTQVLKNINGTFKWVDE